MKAKCPYCGKYNAGWYKGMCPKCPKDPQRREKLWNNARKF